MSFTIDFKGLEVAIVEDDMQSMRGLQESLRQIGCNVVWTARDDEQAMAAAARHLPAVAFIDLRLMRRSDDYETGWELIKFLHQKGLHQNFKAIIYSGTPMTDDIVLDALRMGCSYVIKQDLWDHAQEVLAGALMATSSDSVFLSNEVATGLDSLVVRLQEVDLLSEKEWEVLKLIATGMTNKRISKRLFVAESTVKSHVSSILKKLSVENRGEAADWYRKQNGR